MTSEFPEKCKEHVERVASGALWSSTAQTRTRTIAVANSEEIFRSFQMSEISSGYPPDNRVATNPLLQFVPEVQVAPSSLRIDSECRNFHFIHLGVSINRGTHVYPQMDGI